MGYLRVIYRLLFLFVYTSYTTAKVFTVFFFRGRTIERAFLLRKRWASNLLNHIGLEIHLTGKIPNHGTLIVGNHRSYIDPIVVLKYAMCAPVMRSSVEKWPAIGKGAMATYAISINRESAESRKITLQRINEILSARYSIILYPEGTTTMAPDILPFKKGSFDLAATNGFPVTPVCIEYEDPTLAWVGDDTFLPHFFRCFSKKKIVLYMSFGEPYTSSDYKELLSVSETWIRNKSKELLELAAKNKALSAQ